MKKRCYKQSNITIQSIFTSPQNNFVTKLFAKLRLQSKDQSCQSQQKQIMNNSLFLDNSNPSQFVIRYIEPNNKLKLRSDSVSSKQVLPKPRKKRYHLSRGQIQSVERVSKKIGPVHSMHTNTDEKKQQREYSRVPIQYLDQRDGGNPADRVRGRVIYRGYAPKNTFYFFKTIKDPKYSVSGKDKDYRGQDLAFNSKFQSGNLNAAVRMANRQYWLFMREDTNTHGLRQWFFFEVRSRKSGKFKFRIYRFSKRFSLYRQGMKPYVRTADSDWRQQGEKVVYEYDSQQKCFYLEFQYTFQEHKEVYFATLPPYTYTNLIEWLQNIAVEESVAIKKLGLSLGGLDIFSIIINQKIQNKDLQSKSFSMQNYDKKSFTLPLSQKSQPKQKHGKQAVIVLARTHPGETVSNWSLQSFVATILDTPALTQKYIFFIVPMVNPDGVFLGNHRTGVLGQDLNRNFHCSDTQYFPEVELVQNFVASVNRKHKVAFLFDLHGHSAKRNIFAFGEQNQIGSNKYLYSRIMPKILADSIDSFKLQLCLFKVSREKTNTARVFFSNKYAINSITFEQSYGLLQKGCIGIANWRNFGVALAEALLVYAELGQQQKHQNIRNYLDGVMKGQKEAIIRKRQRQIQLEKKRELEKQMERERERQKEEMRNRSPIKTEGNCISEEPQSKILSELMRKAKIKTPRNPEPEEENQPSQPFSIEQAKQKDQQSEMSSGDESLQLKPAELEIIKKDIFKIGVINREYTRRQLYSMADKKMQLSHQYADYTSRLHHKQSPMVQRLFKFKSKHKNKDSDIINFPSFHQKRNSIELPSIRK